MLLLEDERSDWLNPIFGERENCGEFELCFQCCWIKYKFFFSILELGQTHSGTSYILLIYLYFLESTVFFSYKERMQGIYVHSTKMYDTLPYTAEKTKWFGFESQSSKHIRARQCSTAPLRPSPLTETHLFVLPLSAMYVSENIDQIWMPCDNRLSVWFTTFWPSRVHHSMARSAFLHVVFLMSLKPFKPVSKNFPCNTVDLFHTKVVWEWLQSLKMDPLAAKQMAPCFLWVCGACARDIPVAANFSLSHSIIL